MKNMIKVLSLILALLCVVASFAACDKKPGGGENNNDAWNGEVVDYVANLKLDMSSNTLKQEVTVKSYIDGDTTHFHVPTGVMETGVLKARYLAINTPESTGKIEEWGKTAAKFTREKLEGASAIMIESDNDKWNADSTGDRYLVWVWYKPSADADWRNLNLEILQSGLAIGSSAANNRYGETCSAAIVQAAAQKLYVHSKEKDPNFYYGDALEMTLKQLRCNIEVYTGKKVAFEGVLTRTYNNSVYIEEYDEESGLYYGIAIYLGAGGANGKVSEIMTVGNRVRVVGSLQYYEAGGTYQIADISYSTMRPKDPGNVQLISAGHTPAYVEIDASTFNGKATISYMQATMDENGNITVAEEETSKEFSWAALTMDTTVKMKGLVVKDIYVTDDPASSSVGAMTLTCEIGGKTVTIRTTPMYDQNGNLIGPEVYEGKTIDVQGVVGMFNDAYQIKTFSQNDITVVQ